MSETIKTETIPMKLDRALQCAVALAWEDLTKLTEPRLGTRIEGQLDIQSPAQVAAEQCASRL
jgi:hypothetical protein